MKTDPKNQGAKLRASTRSRTADEFGDEPNMRLTSAFVVVLLLHVVAIGGIWAFNAISSHRDRTRPAAATAAPANPAPPAAKPLTTDPAPPHAHPPPVTARPGETYTVAKGDNPVSIAKRLGVHYGDLLELNGIEDPRKLQIGQKLRIPQRKTTQPTQRP